MDESEHTCLTKEYQGWCYDEPEPEPKKYEPSSDEQEPCKSARDR